MQEAEKFHGNKPFEGWIGLTLPQLTIILSLLNLFL
jgi:hypothetical protein